MNTLYDTHCHIDFQAFDEDRGQVLEAAAEAGVERFMVPGVSAEQWPRHEHHNRHVRLAVESTDGTDSGQQRTQTTALAFQQAF